jgi:hypothetical protein
VELTLLQIRGSEFCLAIVPPPPHRGFGSTCLRGCGLPSSTIPRWLGSLLRLWVMVSSVAQSMLMRSPTEAFQVDIREEIFVEFQE